MSKGIIDIRKEIHYAKLHAKLLQKIDCSKEENKQYMQLINEGGALPEGVYRDVDLDGIELETFYTVYDPQLTEKEQQEYIALMQYEELKTIRKCVVFFTVLASIAAAIGLWIIICAALN